MNALILALLASSCASLCNLFFRKCSSTNTSVYQFLFYYYLSSFVSSFLIRPDLIQNSWNPLILTVGCVAGILNVLMMIITSRALQHTSAGVTFTFQNASSVFPNPLLFLILGSSFGFIVTGYQIAGMILILIGLFTGMLHNNQKEQKSTIWIKYAVGCCFVQTLILCIFQSRFLVFTNGEADDSDVWFMIGFFGMALLFQSCVLIYQNRKRDHSLGESTSSRMWKDKVIYGGLSGIANAGSTYFLLQATQAASPKERGLIFPLFAVSVIILCNLWGYWLYREHPKTALIALCSFGIIVASLG